MPATRSKSPRRASGSRHQWAGKLKASLPLALPHGDLQEVVPDVFFVQGTAAMAPLVSFARNMTVLRAPDGALTLINAVRLSEAGLKELDKLGRVRTVLRLGNFHSCDDAFYVVRYNAQLHAPLGVEWAQEGLVADAVADERLPIAFGARRARIVPLPHASKPECVLFVEHELGNLLIAADALQHHVPPHRASWAAFALMWWMGFFGECVVGPGWFQMQEDKEGVLRDLEKLVDTRDFFILLSAHGNPCLSNANALATRSIAALAKKVRG